MLECGSHMFRHDNSQKSALRIINHILSLSSDMVLGIQHEVVIEERPLNKTRAGKYLLAERARHEKNHADVRKSHEETMRSGSEQMVAGLAEKEMKHQEKIEQMGRDKEQRMQALERDFVKVQRDEQLKWQRAVEDHNRKERELEEKLRQEKARVQALKIKQDIFEAKIEEMQRGHEKRDADREAEAKQERGVNQQRITALEARITQNENDLASRKNSPAVMSVIQALAGVGTLLLGFMNGSTSMIAIFSIGYPDFNYAKEYISSTS